MSRDGRWMRPLYVLYGWVPSGFRQRVIRAIKPSFTISAMPVVTNDRDEVLLVRHSYLRDWGLPGGLLNRGEQPAVGAVREGWEEVGLRVELVGEPAVVVHPDHQVVRIIFRARPLPGNDLTLAGPAPSPEIDERRWFATDALPTMLPESFEALRALERSEGRVHDDG